MKEMDVNNDDILTFQEWMAYWQYIRLAGYEESIIKKTVCYRLDS